MRGFFWLLMLALVVTHLIRRADPPEAPPVIPAPQTEQAALPDDPAMDLPQLDVLRIEPDGTTLLSGRALPGDRVTVLLDDRPLAEVEAEADGGFVSFLTLPERAASSVLSLRVVEKDGTVREAERRFVVGPTPVAVRAPDTTTIGTTPDLPASPRVLASEGGRLEVLSQSPEIEDLSIDTVSYAQDGTPVLGGRAPAETPVRIYLDNEPVGLARTEADGQWRLDLPELTPRPYTLRVDELDEDGSVVSRAETPFRPESPDLLAELAAGAGDLDQIVVQPGYSLWVISEERYGDGVNYVRVFEANSDRIIDPDLIYPGQVLTLPE
ncbi:LysM peptidoglycan-binding domain-containing protein [Palleronia caenipelagi]|uniref:LysM domain-containing protein n=1 Tax=Palleronia caenipelagi TaxID=2489174 RepID=A0A547Q347_9RHOB|nr:LysM peptidoglycan-binding domain-containing protein [Palleronia caenipelagi]TRD20805.1 hypothetical protein FEV53_09265 [Palleronia caenipelagi]